MKKEHNTKIVAKTIPCKWCGKETTYLGTKQCDRCWELSSIIETNPFLANKIMDKLGINSRKLKVFHCIHTDERFPVGCTSIIIAKDVDHAKRLLNEALKKRCLEARFKDKMYTLNEINMLEPRADIGYGYDHLLEEYEEKYKL